MNKHIYRDPIWLNVKMSHKSQFANEHMTPKNQTDLNIVVVQIIMRILYFIVLR